MQKSRDVYTSRDHEMFQNLWFIKNIASYILLHYKYNLQSGWKVKVPQSFLVVLRLFVNIKTVKNKSYLNSWISNFITFCTDRCGQNDGV